MGKYTLEVSSKARKELQFHYRSGKHSVIRKIEQIFQELSVTPYEGTGNPEPLKYQLAGYWSGHIILVAVLVLLLGIDQGKIASF